MKSVGRSALFLDRDGVINRDSAYVHKIDEFEWIPGVFETVRTANGLGLDVFVVTNQAGIARGFYTEQQFQALTAWMIGQFAAAGAPLRGVYYCPYHPEGLGRYRMNSPFRKPAPGMLLQAAAEHGLDLNRSVLIGDQESDIGAGRAAGLMQVARFALGEPTPTAADAVLRNHSEACLWLTGAVAERLKSRQPHGPARRT